jgi:hypothetical protein
VKRRDLLKHLQQHGCQFVREGSAHSIWENPAIKRRTQFLVIEKFLNTQPPVSVSSLTFPPHPETYILLKGKALAIEVTNNHNRFATALHHF